ncbi:kinase-like domain-containing protein [Coprinopsis sp. MPI-PUGE-AT-0042]|nr:kinase-like domain-containing protein [Coprinopsis sp. MPI-PUGE-AT-0042]
MIPRITLRRSFELCSKLVPVQPLGWAARTATFATASTVGLRGRSVLPKTFLSEIVSFSRRSLSRLATKEDDLFNYTSGRWIYNEALRLEERELVFDVDEFMRLASNSVDRRSSDIIEFSKLAEGDCHRVFRITFSDNFQMVARIPYPVTGPKYYGLASEVATMEYLRMSGIPVPKVYGYDPREDNAVGMAYIFMEYVEGRSLNDVWSDLEDKEIVDVVRQITQIEGKMSKLSFPAGGSLYFANDLEKVGLQGVPVPGHERFRIGPDARLLMWHKKRVQLDVDRGPSNKEIAFLKEFGQRVRPTRRHRWTAVKFELQSPSDHIQNLERYLSITEAFIPEDPDLQRFSITHPDLDIIDNIIVNPDCQIVSLIDWQNTAVLPLCLLAGRLIHYGHLNEKRWTETRRGDESDEAREDSLRRLQLLQHHYLKSSEEFNEPHYKAYSALLQAYEADKLFDEFQATAGIGKAGWVSKEDYALARVMVDAGRELIMGKKKQLMGQWHWDDIDEETLAGYGSFGRFFKVCNSCSGDWEGNAYVGDKPKGHPAKFIGLLKPISIQELFDTKALILEAGVDPESELFNYTSGRWVYNDALRLQERRLVFDVDESCSSLRSLWIVWQGTSSASRSSPKEGTTASSSSPSTIAFKWSHALPIR